MTALTQLNTALAGRYEVEREIGAGGMAVVYLATDLRHHRSVALKVLNPELGAVVGVERFLAEIRVTANLQHPNLLPLFDSGEADGLLFYVMPFVQGESLRARLQHEKQLPVDEAIYVAVAIAGALDYAHNHGVIHRDLKPENILMQSGQPMIADFGIALALSKAGGQRVTQTGISLGTPHYMSPEQATGDRQMDGRTDIYSLGAVLYEMLSGEPPHTGATAQAVIARLLTDTPRSVRSTRATVPAYVDAALQCALAKLPADRFATAHEFAQALTGTRSVALPHGVATPGSLAGARDMNVSFTIPMTRVRAYGPWLAGAALVALVALAAWGWLRPAPPRAERPVRFTLAMPPGLRIAEGLLGATYALSPDGHLIAYLATDDLGSIALYVRPIDQLQARTVDGSRGARSPVFSPDGRWLAFSIGPDIKKVAVDGGPLQTIGSSQGSNGLSWGVQDQVIVGGVDLRALPASGGASRGIFKTEPSGQLNTLSVNSQALASATGLGFRWPLALSDGETVFFTKWTSGGLGSATINVASLSTGKVDTLGIVGTNALALVDGTLLYSSATGAIMAVPIDLKHRRVTGNAVPVVQDVIVDAAGGAKAAITKGGDLVYLSGQSVTLPVMVDARGATRNLIDEPRVYSTPRYSPDGRRVAFTVGSAQSLDVWIYDIAKTTLTRLTTEGTNVRPEWSPDGKRVLFRSERQNSVGIWWQAADGSGVAEPLYRGDMDPYEAVLSPDAKYLILRTSPGARFSRDIFYRAMQGDTSSKPLLVSPYAEQMPRVSPDGRWMAYMSDESGQLEIYVRPFPNAGGRVQVSTAGGTDPLWSRDGRTLYYRSGQKVIGAAIRTGADVAIGARTTVLEGDYVPNASHQNYDVAPDGKHLLMIKRAGGEAQTIFVHNWLSEVRARLGGAAPR